MRVEEDFLGKKEIADEVLWGIHTQRALENFSISNFKIPRLLIQAYGLVKKAAALTNFEIGFLEEKIYKAIDKACDDLIEGKLDEYIVVDPFQGGAGTSLNMNINEVIANKALIYLGEKPGNYEVISPLNHVNLHQSTNDTFPTAVKIAVLKALEKLENSVILLLEELQKKEREFSNIVKIGRTQLQDAVLMTLGKEFSAFADAIARDRWRIFKASERIKVVNIGGSAIGTGIGVPRKYIFKVIDNLRALSRLNLARAENLIDATSNHDSFVEVSAVIKALAVNLIKIANDLRFLSSGPDAGISEIKLPPRQVGSSIMPGKINPVMPEMIIQAAIYFISCDNIVTTVAYMGNLQLNSFLPILSFSLIEGIMILANGIENFAKYCVKGIEPNIEKCKKYIKNSVAVATSLLPIFGYEKTSKLLKKAKEENKSLQELVVEEGLMSKEEFEKLISAKRVCKLGYSLKEYDNKR